MASRSTRRGRRWTTICRQLEAEYPQFNRDVRAAVQPLANVLVQNVRPALLVLFGAVSLVLLIACANVANLLLVRAVGRQKEIALRTALGGSRARIVRQLVIESVLLACVGGGVGVLMASWGVTALMTTVTVLPRAGKIGLDLPVLAFALALSVATGLIFGLVPALQATRLDLRDVLNEEGRGSSGGGLRHRRMRSALVVAEIALALVLLVGAGLMLRSFSALVSIDAGFDASKLLIVDLPLSPTVYRDDLPRTTMVERIVERARQLPGVKSAAVTTGLPMTGGGATIHFNIAGTSAKGARGVSARRVPRGDARLFRDARHPVRRGRTFTDRDRAGAPLVGVINESMARQHFADVDPIGQRFAVGTRSRRGDAVHRDRRRGR